MNKKKIILWILACLPLVMTLCVYSRLPEQIPGQWGFNGTVRYDDKSSLFFLGGIGIVITILMTVFPKIDPKKENYKNFKPQYENFIIIILLFMNAMTAIVISESFYPGRISISNTVTILIGILFIAGGNMLPKTKRNFFVGVKLPWTISDSQTWNKTNRLMGIIMFISGIILIISAFFVSDMILFLVLIAIILFMTIVPLVMSIVWYYKRNNQIEE